MKIIAAVDSFKGTLSSIEISHILKECYEKQDYEVIPVPISDGGEGFLDAIHYHTKAPLIPVSTIGPLEDPIESEYLIYQNTAYIELSRVVGLNEISAERLNPLKTTTYGLGKLVKHALKQNISTIVIGIGGSSTNDGAAGFLQALGVNFFAGKKQINIPLNGQLIGQVTHIDDSTLKEEYKNITFILASDVSNPLLGENGCSHVYAAQKGASISNQQELESAMMHYADCVEGTVNGSFRFQKGSGAAGGFGFGLSAFLNAKIIPGIDFIMELVDLENKIKNADLVFVGEGRFDYQTSFGKAPYGVAQLARKHGKKVIGIFGKQDFQAAHDIFDQSYVIVPKYADETTSLNAPKQALQKMIKEIKV